MQGSGVEVVRAENDTYQLEVENLKWILLRDQVKDLPVAVISIAGAYRGGKSFLLNFFLRYIEAPHSSQLDGSWLGEENMPLEGFKWCGGPQRNTTGIVIWSEPIVATLKTGEKVAVILMDTQGTFDSSSTVRDCSTIFALSTLLSSVQIYNLSRNIGEDNLQHLQLFTEYGRLVNNKDSNSKAFQALEFLIRDWPHADDFPYGSIGGNSYLDVLLKIDPKMNKDMRGIREHIKGSFEMVSCFLLPHPGFEVHKKDFKGQTSVITAEFKEYIKELTKHIFAPSILKPKEIAGQKVTASELFNYFEEYVKIFNSDKMPSPTSIMRATAKAGFLSAYDESWRIYEAGMESECGPSQPSLPAHDLEFVHQNQATKAFKTFTEKKKMGSTSEAEDYLAILEEDIEKRLAVYINSNIGKIQKTIADAKELYETKTGQIKGKQMLCAHPIDLEEIHANALQAALDLFDNNRRTILNNKKDKDRATFEKSFQKNYEHLKLINAQNNKMIVTELRLKYWQTMEQKCSQRVLSESEFKSEHQQALACVLQTFYDKRTIPNWHSEDEYKTDLIQLIDNCYIQIMALNNSKNKIALQSAFEVYDNHMAAARDSETECLHPSDLNLEHQVAECSALAEMRPTRVSSGKANFDLNDEDEKILSEVLAGRFKEIKKNNDAANETAVSVAVNLYSDEMYFNCGFSIWWILGVGIPYLVNRSRRTKYHKESKKKALAEFYKTRRASTSTEHDEFMEDLRQNIAAIRREYFYATEDVTRLRLALQ